MPLRTIVTGKRYLHREPPTAAEVFMVTRADIGRSASIRGRPCRILAVNDGTRYPVSVRFDDGDRGWYAHAAVTFVGERVPQ